ncbi:MAG: TolC family protein [Thiohalobacterales bacterium]|nr:TolC family protein [Thiohalobacterales bacterium]
MTGRVARLPRTLLTACLLWPVQSVADPLPAPLTLQAALAAAATHPSVELGQAELALEQAEADSVRARNDLEIGAALAARAIEPPERALDQRHNDSRALIYARKRLYDFGHTRALETAADASVQGAELRAGMSNTRHRLDVIEAFFDVLLADLEFARDNEAMAVAYVQADRSRDRNELGQMSDVVLMQRETEYQRYRMQRLRSQARQRSTRARLAQLLDRPDELSADLMRPDLSSNDVALPEYEALVAAALENNPGLRALRADLEAARQQLAAARTARRPVLSGEFSAGEYQREISSSNPAEAELRVEIPLYDGQRSDAGTARAQADVYRLNGELRQQELNLRQQLLELSLEIETLLAQREQVSVFRQSRQLNFDLAQAEYEMQLKTDFGHALVGQSESALLDAETEFSLALKRAWLAALTGLPLSPYMTSTAADNEGES